MEQMTDTKGSCPIWCHMYANVWHFNKELCVVYFTKFSALEDQAIQLQNNSTNNTTSLCQCERYRFHFTFAEFIILGTLLLLIVLALANIFVSKTHIMEVKHDTNLVMGTNYNHNVHGQTQRSGGNQRRNGTATTTLTHTTEGDQKKKKSKPTGKATNKSHKTGDGQVTRVAKSRSGDYESDDGWSDFEDEEEDYGRTEVDNDNLYILCNGASNQEYFTFGDLWLFLHEKATLKIYFNNG